MQTIVKKIILFSKKTRKEPLRNIYYKFYMPGVRYNNKWFIIQHLNPIWK